MYSVKCLGKVASYMISNQVKIIIKSSWKNKKRMFGDFCYFPRLLTLSCVWDEGSDNKPELVW